ncbi:MAG: hypothetical protein ACSHXL_00245 [Bacteroidota bacterium]
MTYGAQITNSSGDLVFTTEEPVFQVIGKGTVSLDYVFNTSIEIWLDPNYSSYSVESNLPVYRNQDAVGDWDDDVLTLYEINSGDRVYKWETVDTSNGNRIQRLWSHSKASVRYVQVRLSSTLPAPNTDYGMVFYDESGAVTWSDSSKVLDNVLPLSVTSTTNRWFYWSGTPARTDGSFCGNFRIRGIRGSASSFIKEASSIGYLTPANSSFRDTRFCGLTFDRSTHGFSANIDWNSV